MTEAYPKSERITFQTYDNTEVSKRLSIAFNELYSSPVPKLNCVHIQIVFAYTQGSINKVITQPELYHQRQNSLLSLLLIKRSCLAFFLSCTLHKHSKKSFRFQAICLKN